MRDRWLHKGAGQNQDQEPGKVEEEEWETFGGGAETADPTEQLGKEATS